MLSSLWDTSSQPLLEKYNFVLSASTAVTGLFWVLNECPTRLNSHAVPREPPPYGIFLEMLQKSQNGAP